LTATRHDGAEVLSASRHAMSWANLIDTHSIMMNCICSSKGNIYRMYEVVVVSLLLFVTEKAISFSPPVITRRKWWISFVAGGFIFANQSGYAAGETIGKDEDCNDSTCLGVWDGLLADCPHGQRAANAECTSSQDDTPGIFSEPWDYSDANSLDWQEQMRLLVPTIQLASSRRGDRVDIIYQNGGRYLRVLFTDAKTGEQSTGEFYFTPNDSTVQFRVGTISVGPAGLVSPSMKNMERCEMIRKEMRYQKLPILRNRRRTFFFAESELDTFGPGSASLGPPAEMTTGELNGRQVVNPKLKIDLLQGFPFSNR
jgi:hypothetical protein